MQRRGSSGSVPLSIICTRHYGVCVVKTDSFIKAGDY